MHPASTFHWTDQAALRNFAEAVGFGILAVSKPFGVGVAHLPFLFLGPDRVGFHMAKRNPIAIGLDGQRAVLVVNGPQAYVSPDWYGLDHNQVPTWNYLAAEFEGHVSALSNASLIAQVDALTAMHESRLAPKPEWTRAKMDDGRFEKMIEAVHGFELRVTDWRGTAKLGQNKPKSARMSAADAIQAAGNGDLAALLREPPNG